MRAPARPTVAQRGRQHAADSRGRARRGPPGRPAQRTGTRGPAPARHDLTGPELARQLFVSLNTLRTHTKRIFTKLDVTNRTAAVRRARELGL